MELAVVLLCLAGFLIIHRYSEGEFTGSSEDEARRLKGTRAGLAVAFVGLVLELWSDYA